MRRATALLVALVLAASCGDGAAPATMPFTVEAFCAALDDVETTLLTADMDSDDALDTIQLASSFYADVALVAPPEVRNDFLLVAENYGILEEAWKDGEIGLASPPDAATALIEQRGGDNEAARRAADAMLEYCPNQFKD